MKISIALCTYNGERYLADQLLSYLNQSRLPDELVICDDRSTDRTPEILAEFAARAPFLVDIHTNDKNLGSTKNFEKVFQLCQGDVIAPSDQDDVWHVKKLRRLETAFNENPKIGLIFTNANVVDANLDPLNYTLWQSIKFTQTEQSKLCNGDTVSVLMKHNIVTGATMAFRADFRSLFTPIPDLWIHDAWIAFIIALVADILPLSESLIEYRKHEDNQVGTPGINLLTEIDYALGQKKDLQSHIYEKYNILRKRVESQFPDKNEVLYQIDEQIVHRQKRADLPKNRLHRLPIILRELLTKHYHKYSFGYLSAAKDFLL
jgi:glycosyltransferase involved in cell wall biosynthesis